MAFLINFADNFIYKEADLVLDSLYFLDIILSFFTGFFDMYDNIIVDQSLIMKRYLK